ncbi:serine/threonine-protein kinase [Streptomyces aidingensis]|uniref:non-specific serine/threonine protein kinase n=1 Tax=Streptomyces aidingensis TaxID=910347 RepID=A0A1I1LLN3_9ACTN|nr:serine/threonine-protein kinase [Streptomyces aidingensis]SFC73885.1 Serine/threonine protein kinase [Streptomyces aidingensis]
MPGGADGTAGGGGVVDGRFRLLERLGHGGMGTVWRARDLALERDVALKEMRMPPEPAADPGAAAALRERAMREARALARLSHPHVVTVHHIVDGGALPWIVMELLPGRSLADLCRGQGPVDPARAARYGRQILAALRAAHAAGVLHRDVKPANVLLREDGDAVLTDFGIATVHGSASVTMPGQVIGSPEYLAPERVREQEGPASDLWSLGMTLYALTEGTLPFSRGTALATLAAVVTDPVPPPVRSGPLAPALRAVLVKDPAARPDAAELDALLAAAERPAAERPAPAPRPLPPVPPVPAPRPDTAPARAPRTRAALLAGALALLLIGGGVTARLLTGAGGSTADAAGTGGPGTGREEERRQPDDGAADPSADRRPDGGGADDEAGGPDPGPAEEDLTAPSPGPAAEPSTGPDPGGSAVPGEDSAGTWIAQLFSEPAGNGPDARDQRLAAVRETVPEARVLRSDDFASLNPGFWVIYAPGPFPDGRAALDFCAGRGHTTANDCVGRYLSHDAGDRQYICFPDDRSSPRCER